MNGERLVNKGIELSGGLKGVAEITPTSGDDDGKSSSEIVGGSVIDAKVLANAGDLVRRLAKAMRELPRAETQEARLELLAELHSHLGSLNSRLANANLHLLSSICVSLSKLFTTFTRDFQVVNLSSLRTSSHALDILSLALSSPDPKLLRNPVFRILVVDDHAVCRHTLSMALNSPYLKLNVCEDAAAALALLETSAFDAIFTDIMMPEMDGFGMVASLRKIAGHERTPVVFVTALSDFETRAKSVLSGGCDLIAKPFGASEVVIKALTIALKHRLEPGKILEPVQLPVEIRAPRIAPQIVPPRVVAHTPSEGKSTGNGNSNGNGHHGNGKLRHTEPIETEASRCEERLKSMAEKLSALEKQLAASQSALPTPSAESHCRPGRETLPELAGQGSPDATGAAEPLETLLERERTERRLLERRCARLESDIQHYQHQLAAHKSLEEGFRQREGALKRQLDDEIEQSRQATQALLAAQATASRLLAIKPACQAIHDKIQLSSAALNEACRDLSSLVAAIPMK